MTISRIISKTQAKKIARLVTRTFCLPSDVDEALGHASKAERKPKSRILSDALMRSPSVRRWMAKTTQTTRTTENGK